VAQLKALERSLDTLTSPGHQLVSFETRACATMQRAVAIKLVPSPTRRLARRYSLISFFQRRASNAKFSDNFAKTQSRYPVNNAITRTTPPLSRSSRFRVANSLTTAMSADLHIILVSHTRFSFIQNYSPTKPRAQLISQ